MRTNILTTTSFLIAVATLSTQSVQALTREEVKAEPAELHALGYHPGGGGDPQYPKQLQETMARLHEKRMMERSNRATTGAQSSPVRSAIDNGKSSAPHGDQQVDQCVGPASFCNIYHGS
ncbi:DUF4148 domain-containing protein [Burkholderia ubonensis]|uniref:DUF4148 domain-containing protein n=1 Tax=Burkholderia ubonensis TaxID=101571 RepID=UPI0009B49F31